MKIRIELTEEDVKDLVRREIEARLGSIPFDEARIKVETKSKQNYRSEWETAAYRAVYEVA